MISFWFIVFMCLWSVLIVGLVRCIGISLIFCCLRCVWLLLLVYLVCFWLWILCVILILIRVRWVVWLKYCCVRGCLSVVWVMRMVGLCWLCWLLMVGCCIVRLCWLCVSGMMVCLCVCLIVSVRCLSGCLIRLLCMWLNVMIELCVGLVLCDGWVLCVVLIWWIR